MARARQDKQRLHSRLHRFHGPLRASAETILRLRDLEVYLPAPGRLYTVKETTLYSAFAHLERGGLVEEIPQAAENGKRRTYYRVTPARIDRYQVRCREWRLTEDVVGRFMEGYGA